MSAPVSPGPASLEGLRWLCRVGPAPFEAWRCAMGWAPGNARWHTIRLAREQWIDRVALPRGDGSLIYATPEGLRVADIDVPTTPVPAPTWWAHLAACAWAAAWLTTRGRGMLGPRQLAADQTWHGQLTGLPGRRQVTHVPDLVGIVPGQRPATVEVELARKSKTRLRAILGLHAQWIAAGQAGACVYVCGSSEIRDLIISHASDVGLRQDTGTLRVEMLDTIKQIATEQRATVLRGTPHAGSPR